MKPPQIAEITGGPGIAGATKSVKQPRLLFDAGMPKTPAAWYAQRRTLPPWRFDELLDEMVRHLPEYGVDEVILIPDTEEFSHGFPSLDWIRDYQPLLLRAREALEGVGIVYSLNPWITIGHASRGRCFPIVVPPIEPMVNEDGVVEKCVACPLSEGWRSYQKAAWTLFAETEPAVIWIEDDIRGFGTHFCSCPHHLSRFAARVGRTVTREELMNALLQPGEPHPWRGEFLRMQDEIMRDAVDLLVSSVHVVSPETRIGLMSSGPRNHVQEGRDWKRLSAGLKQAGEPIFSRPTMGNYWEWDLRGLYFAADSIKLTRHALPAGALDMTEVEGVPFSRNSNSMAFLTGKIALSFAYGARGATINIFDHLGSPMQDFPECGQLLAALKPGLNALAGETQRPGVYRGIRLFHFDRAADTYQLRDGAKLVGLRGEGENAMQAFEAAGIPTTYDESEVAAISGQQARLISDQDLRGLLTHGLFLDGLAAHLLCERGFGPLIGMESADAPLPLEELGAISAEEYLNVGFGGAPRLYLSALLPNASYDGSLGRLHPLPGAAVISRIVNPDTNALWPAMTAFENAEGGRVIVHGWDYVTSVGSAYYGPYRSRQLQAVAQWLFRGAAPLLAEGDGAWPLAFRKDCGDHTVVGLIQLSMDSWPEGVLTLNDERQPAAVERLDALGCWSERDITTTRQGRTLTLRFHGSFAFGYPVVARIAWAKRATPKAFETSTQP